MMDDFRAETIRLALQKMFTRQSYFDICTVRTCLDTANVVPPRDELQGLEALHCVQWSDMTPEMREEVARRVFALFGHPEWDPDDLTTPLIGGNGERGGLFRRLIGRGADA